MPTWSIGEPRRLTIEGTVDRLTVSLVAGRVNVVGTDGPARVEVDRVGRRPVVVEHVDGVLTVRNPRLRPWRGVLWWLFGWLRRVRTDVSVAVPARARADVRVAAGEAVVSGLRADTRVDVTSGHVTLLGLAGRTSAKVIAGGVEALGVGGELSLEVTSGELTLADSTAERVDARTVSGSITCDLDHRQSDIRLGAISGSVTVRVRDDSDLAVHLHTTSGRITSAFAQVDPLGSAGSRDAHGILGTGTGNLRASTTSGSIALLARPAHDREEGLA